jgi:hypothetical protein
VISKSGDHIGARFSGTAANEERFKVEVSPRLSERSRASTHPDESVLITQASCARRLGVCQLQTAH